MSTVTVDDRMLTRREAAAYLGLAEQTLSCWATSGRYGLRYLKIGRKVRYRLSDLEHWLRDRERTQTGE